MSHWLCHSWWNWNRCLSLCVVGECRVVTGVVVRWGAAEIAGAVVVIAAAVAVVDDIVGSDVSCNIWSCGGRNALVCVVSQMLVKPGTLFFHIILWLVQCKLSEDASSLELDDWLFLSFCG